MFSKFPSLRSKSEQQENTQGTYIIQSSNARMLTLRSIIVFRMLITLGTIFWFHKNLNDNPDRLISNEYGLPVLDFFAMLYIAGDLIDLVHTFREEKRYVHSVHEEVEKNHLDKSRAASNLDNPLLVTSELVLYPYKSVQWKIGEKQLYKHIAYMIDTFDYLNKYKIDDLPQTPKQFTLLYNLLPFQRPNIDMPTKTRLVNCILGPFGYLTGKYLANFYNLSPTASFVLPISLAVITVGSVALESYHLNQIKLELNLEGFSYKHEKNAPRDDWKKTCIGTQMTRQILLYPSNKNFLGLLNYVAKGEIKIHKLLADDKLPEDVKKKLSKFKFFLEVKYQRYEFDSHYISSMKKKN